MEFSIYDAFLDPVIVISDEGAIQYVNMAGRRWLTVVDEDMDGKPLDQYVFFSDTNMFSQAASLQAWQSTRHEKAKFRCSQNNYEASATVCIQKIPFAEDFVYTIIVRDLAFANAIDVNSWQEAQSERLEQTASSPVGIASDTAFLSHGNLLDEVTLTKSMPKEPMARYDSRINIFIIEHKLALVGACTMLSDNWVEAVAKAENLIPGLNCNLDIQGSDKLKAITVSSKITEIHKTENDSLRIRFQFENMGVLTKRAIEEFLQKYSTPV